MISTLPSSTYVGVSNPLMGQINPQRVSNQILTNDFERLHTRGVENVAKDSQTSAVKNTVDADKPAFIRMKGSPRSRSPSVRFKDVVLEGTRKIKHKQAASALKRSAAYVNAAYQSRSPAKASSGSSLNVIA